MLGEHSKILINVTHDIDKQLNKNMSMHIGKTLHTLKLVIKIIKLGIDVNYLNLIRNLYNKSILWLLALKVKEQILSP